MESSEGPRNLAGMKVPAVGAPDLQEESPHSLRSTLPTGPFQPTHATSSGSFPGRHQSGEYRATMAPEQMNDWKSLSEGPSSAASSSLGHEPIRKRKSTTGHDDGSQIGRLAAQSDVEAGHLIELYKEEEESEVLTDRRVILLCFFTWIVSSAVLFNFLTRFAREEGV
ncbi:hypothetical protein PSTG_11915 [Puccinia striiformis f. sp. tritici PST-78]|uniref:Uncharacterized protein n=1 Tax=Puccinia striiformis f. sp. tritici PST-78 TaxID=1165861 RepID=A0A0L0V628_9BASI|nr:hypothetical protein PSTG_11915 [Puccinia striiformis f. sp. tritici PST-78]